MATYATDVYDGTGSQIEFAVTFDFIQRDHVRVYRIQDSDGAETELTQVASSPLGDEYQWQSNILIQVGIPPTTEQKLRIQRDTPEDQQLVQWTDGSYIVADDLNTSDLQLLYGIQELEDKVNQLDSQALKFLGAIDLTVDDAPAKPVSGDYYINTGLGQVLPSWVGIAGQSVSGSEQVIYDGTAQQWTIVQTPDDQQGVLTVTGNSPIVVDNTDPQRPVISSEATVSVTGEAPIIVNNDDPQRPEVQLSTLANAPIVQTLQGSTLVSTFDINVLSSLP